MNFKDFKNYEPYFSNNEGLKLIQALASPEILQNPYPYYHFLQSKGQINWLADKAIPETGYYIVHEYDVTNELLKSASIGRNDSYANWPEEEKRKFDNLVETNPYLKMKKNWLLYSDPPEHTSIRSLLNKVFTPRRFRELSEPITNIVYSLLEKIDTRNKFDLLTSWLEYHIFHKSE